jgi:hypothetical protein
MPTEGGTQALGDVIHEFRNLLPRLLSRSKLAVIPLEPILYSMRKPLRSLVLSLPFYVALLAVPGTVPAQDRVAHLEPALGRDPLSTTVVEVSVRQVRFAFPSDSSGRWGWPDRTPIGTRYEWSALVGGMDGPMLISLLVYPEESTINDYSSLKELVAAGQAKLCIIRYMTSPCNESPLVHSTVEGSRVVLTLADSILIRELFGTRPDRVRVLRQLGESETHETELVSVRYVAPALPEPDSALLAEAQHRRRRYEASITTIGRRITSGGEGLVLDDLWIAVGDSLRLDVKETRCRVDYCGGLAGQVSDSGWSVKNSRIVSLRRTCGPGCAMVYGHRVGKTTISAVGLHAGSDTLPSSPPARRVDRGIRVGKPVATIRVMPRPDTVLLGQSYTFGAQAFDRSGKVVPDVPIEILVDIDSSFKRGMLATRPASIEFQMAGRRSVIATFRGLADTLVVTVVEEIKAR